MTHEPPSRIVRWPLAIGVVSFLYGLAYGLMFVRPQSLAARPTWAVINVVIAICFLAGGIGVVLRKPWATTSLLSGSYLVFTQAVYSFVMVCLFIGGAPPIFVLLGMFTMMTVAAAWPIFLIIWLRRRSGLKAPIHDDQQSP